jgi:hypothetical protein
MSNKNRQHMENPNSLASGTHDSDMLLILRLSILGRKHKQNHISLASGNHDSDMLLILKLSILGSLELLED